MSDNTMQPAGAALPRQTELFNLSPAFREDVEMLLAIALFHNEITTSRAQEILGTQSVRRVRDVLAYWRDALPLLSALDHVALAQPDTAEMLDVVRAAGPAHRNMTAPMTADEHGAEFARMVRDTQHNHGLDDGPLPVHWLSVKDGLSLAFVGCSPNSPHLARALTGAWNRLVAEATPTPGGPQ